MPWGVTPVDPYTKMGHKHRVHFEYDYMGRRVRKVTYPWNVGTEDWMEAPDSDIRFVYDGWNLVQEIDGLVTVESGVTDVVREYTWGLDLSGQGGNPSPSGIHGAGGIGGLLGTHWTGNTTSTSDDKAYIYFYDANGNVGQMIDVVSGSSGYGTIAAKYEYYPFGGLLVADGVAAEANPFRFSTKYRDNETGCYYYGYRYLRTKHGRWLSRDPIEEESDVNLFRFAYNLPLIVIDPLGLESTVEQHPPGGGGLGTLTFSELLKKAKIGGHITGSILVSPSWDGEMVASACRSICVPSQVCPGRRLYFCGAKFHWTANHKMTIHILDVTPDPNTDPAKLARAERIAKCLEDLFLKHEMEHAQKYTDLMRDFDTYGLGVGCTEAAALDKAKSVAEKVARAKIKFLTKKAKEVNDAWDKKEYATVWDDVIKCFKNTP